MRTIILFCFLFLNLVCSLALKAQINPQPHFRNYSTEHGLPSPEVYTAFQDSKGYIWFGTDNGATRFDGYEFKNYGAKQGLSSNVVFDIFEDEEQNIWFGTMTGEAFMLKGDTIIPYQYNSIILQYRSQFQDGALAYLASNNTAYFELINLGVLRIDSQGQDSLYTSNAPLAMMSLDLDTFSQSISTIVRKFNHENFKSFVQNTYHSGVVIHEVINSNDGNLSLELPLDSNPPKTSFYSFKLGNGYRLVFYDGKLFCFYKEILIWTQKFEYRVNEVHENLDKSIIICLAEGKGLRKYQDWDALKDNKFESYLQGLSISNYIEDKERGVWITSQEQGIFYSANLYAKIYDSKFGFSHDFVTSLAVKDDSTIYVGIKTGDIYEIDISRNKTKNIIKNIWGYHNFDLFFHGSTKRLWSNGVFWSENQWHELLTVDLTGELKSANFFRFDKIQINSRGELLGCNHSGISIIDFTNGIVTHTGKDLGLIERTFAVYEDKQNQTWVGTARGIFQFNDQTYYAPAIEHPAFNIRVEDIHELNHNKLVFGTKGWGVVLWDKNQHFIILTEEHGLTSNMIEDVHVDENGVLWIGTLNGLNKVTFNEREEPTIRQFTIAHGLPSNEIYKIKSHKGQVWLCTAGGLVRFQETEVETEATSPILQAIEVNGRGTTRKDLLQLSYQDNNFVFQFLTIDYKQNGNIQYRFRLHENEDWSYTKNRTTNYPALPPDQYRFEVQSKNEDGLWSNSTIQYFTIAPPWWATSWFIILVSLSFMASSFGIFQYRLQQLKKRSLIQQQISDLEKSALQAQMNPHFIFNCLNSIQNFILQHNSQKAVDFLSRFARLVRLHLNASMDGYISLEKEISLLDNYLILEQERFEHKFQFQLELDPSIEPDQIQIPPLLIQPFVENAIVHGMANKQKDGRIQIKFLKKDEHLQVTIRDNGKDQDLLNNHRKSHDYKSVGMSITQKRLQLMDQSETEVLEITSVKDQDPQTEGTLVTILIKYQSL